MTITELIIGVAIFAVIWTFVTAGVFNQRKSLMVSFLQNYCGGLFIFSGWVKVVDPLGTSYKLVDYFTEFESVFAETWMSFIAPIFPLFSSYSVSVSVFFVVLEIVLGFMLLVGAHNKLTSWLFFFIVGFFTFLTGFTALTGYVPEGVNFFDFGNWGAFKESNMKVTDCGCFGDFIKLKPFVSFKKDVALLFPAILFLFKWKDMHSIFSPKTRNGVTIVSTVFFLLYALNSFVWDIPHMDFRPFRNGVNVRAQKTLEEDAMANAPVFYTYTDKETGAQTKLSMDEYMKQYKNFPKEKFDVEQIQDEPTVPHTKISEFSVEDPNGEVTEELLNHKGYSLMYVSYTLDYKESEKTVMIPDTSWTVDTVGTVGTADFQMVKKVDKITSHQETVNDYIFDASFKKRFEDIVNPFAVAAQKAGVKVYAIAGRAGEEVVKDFGEEINATYPIYMADDILLKTIVRSNPGIVLLKDGVILQKWHYKKLPDFDKVKAEFMTADD